MFQVDQQRISALDTIAMTIRGWTVTLVSAIVGFSLSQHHRSLLPVAMVRSPQAHELDECIEEFRDESITAELRGLSGNLG